MNSSLLAVGAGGLLLGGLGGFVVGGGSGESDSVGNGGITATKSSSGVSVATSGRDQGSSASSSGGDISRQSSQTARVQKLLDFYSNLSPDLYESEADKLEALPFSERILASYLLFSQWAQTDAEGALAYSDRLGRAGFFVKPTILQGWAGSDPAVAAKFLQENPRKFARLGMGRRGATDGNGAAGTIGTEWARQDPEAAMAWAKALKGPEAVDAIAGVMREVAKDPVAAVALAKGLSGEEQVAAHKAIAKAWGNEDFPAMKAWASGLPADQQEAAMLEGLQGYASSDPRGAALESLSFKKSNLRDIGIRTSVESWSRQDPEEAMDFLLTNGSEEVQEDAMRNVMSSLAKVDSAAGLAKIETLNEGPVRDRAISTYAFNVEEGAPQDTINLAATIADDRTRERTVSIATSRWLQDDPTAANQFLNSTDLMTPETIADIRERAESGRGFRGRGRGRN